MLRRLRLLGLFFALPACSALAIAACVGDAPGASGGGGDGSVSDGASGGDGSTSGDSSSGDSGPSGPCNLAADFSAPVAVAGLDVLGSAARFSDDELIAYFAIFTTDGGPQYLGQAKRTTLADPFGAPDFIPSGGAPLVGFQPSLTSDQKTLYFSANALDGGLPDIFATQRSDPDAGFGGPSLISGVESTDKDEEPFIAFSGDLWFSSERSSGANFHVWRAAKNSGGGGFLAPGEPNNVNSASGDDEYPVVSRDGLTLYFTHAGVETMEGSKDVWATKRSDLAADFSAPGPVANVNTTDTDRASWVSTDGCRLYIAKSVVSGTNAPISMWMAQKPAN